MADDDGLLREVDADMRTERLMAAWRQYRSLLVVFVVSVLLATTANVLWQNYRVHRGGVWLEQLTAAQNQFNQGNFIEAEKGFAVVAAEASGELSAVAAIWHARALIGQGNIAKAVTVLTTAAQTKSLWGDVACLRLAAISAKDATCLSDPKTSPLAWQRGAWAAAEFWQAGDKARAVATLEPWVLDASTPEASRAELQQWLATMKTAK